MKAVFKAVCLFFLCCSAYTLKAQISQPIQNTQNIQTESAAITKSDTARFSDSLYEELTKNGFTAEKQLLQNTLSSDFPYNVIVPIQPPSPAPAQTANKAETASNERKLIISVTQQNVSGRIKEYMDFIRKLKERSAPFQIEIVFTANDYSETSQVQSVGTTDMSNTEMFYAGTYTYINALDTTENTAVLIIGTDKKNERLLPQFVRYVQIIPGGINYENRGVVIPRGFFKTITDACANAGIFYSIRGRFLSLYRLGLIKAEPLVSAWLSSEIPASMLVSDEQNFYSVFTVIEECVNLYAACDFTDTDTHYSLFRLFNKSLWISERTYLIFLILTSAVTLFAFFILSFIRGTHRYIHRQEFLQTWYLIPVMIGSGAFFLSAAQVLTAQILQQNYRFALFALAVKTAFALSFLILFFVPQHVLKLPLTGFIYGYLLSVGAFLNIFLFASADIALIPIFIVEYLIVYISRGMRKISSLIAALVFMLLPYIPFITAFTEFDSALYTRFISEASFAYNVLFAAVLFPFLIMGIRILIRLKLWGRRINSKARRLADAKNKMFAQSAFALICFCAVFIVSTTVFLFTTPAKRNNAVKTLPTKKTVSLSLERTVRFEHGFFVLHLSSALPVIRYHIEINSQSALPVFESNYPYDMFAKPLSAVFALDDYPPEPFTLNFSTDGVHDTLCTITAYFKDGGVIKTEQLHYTITGIPK